MDLASSPLAQRPLAILSVNIHCLHGIRQNDDVKGEVTRPRAGSNAVVNRERTDEDTRKPLAWLVHGRTEHGRV